MWLPAFCCFRRQQAGEEFDSDDDDAEGVGSNPIVRTYLIPNEHGTCKRYWAEFILVVGLVLPWMGPIGSLCVASPFIKLGVQQSQVKCLQSTSYLSGYLVNILYVLLESLQVITPDTDCFGSAYAVCDAESYFDYYFWNVTNAAEVSMLRWSQDCENHSQRVFERLRDAIKCSGSRVKLPQLCKKSVRMPSW